jgi:phospholipase/carboxylesterase
MSDLPQLTGPSFGPAAGGAPHNLVILLHGYGANGDDLIGLAPPFSQGLPNTEFLSPNAPYPCEGNPFGGLQWFEVWQAEGVDRLAEVRNGAAIVNAFIDEELAQRNLTDDKLILCGFSQGTMMALYLGPRRARACAAIVGYSGRLIGGEALAAETRSRPPILLVHGESDPVVPVAALPAAVEGLTAAGLTVEWHRRPRVEHGIDEFGLVVGAEFIATAFSA